MLQLLEGPELRMQYWEDREDKRAQLRAGFEPRTSLLSGVLSTAVLQPLTCCLILKIFRLFWLLRVTGEIPKRFSAIPEILKTQNKKIALFAAVPNFETNLVKNLDNWIQSKKISSKEGIASSWRHREIKVRSAFVDAEKIFNETTQGWCVFFSH